MTEHPSGHKEGHQKKEVVVSSKLAPEKKEGLFAYFKSSWTEFKKVVWPSRDEAVKNDCICNYLCCDFSSLHLCSRYNYFMVVF